MRKARLIMALTALWLLCGNSVVSAQDTDESCASKNPFINMAYDILGDLISKVSKMPFEQFIKQNILDPLGMVRSTILFKELDKTLMASPHLMNEKFEFLSK